MFFENFQTGNLPSTKNTYCIVTYMNDKRDVYTLALNLRTIDLNSIRINVFNN